MTTARLASPDLVSHAVRARAALDLRMLATTRQEALAAVEAAGKVLAALARRDAPDWTAEDVDRALDAMGVRLSRNGGESA